MILVDTSVWVAHFRRREARLVELLEKQRVLVHPWVLGELALGHLPDRSVILHLLSKEPGPVLASDDEVLCLVESRLQGSGIGWVDAHLAASARLSGALLWTRDRRLAKVARRLEIDA